MNSLVIILISIVALFCGYVFYGKWLAKKWGLDAKAKTPAETLNDGEDYVPSNKLTVFSHQFSSIAGAGPVTGPILAAVFGWVPVLLWILIGGIFFGAVQDFGSLYVSVKNEGKSMGMIIEKYIGKTGRKLFLLFCWLFTLLVIAAFTDMVAGTFNGIATDGSKVTTSGAAASISMLFIVVAIIFGLFIKKFNPKPVPQAVIAIVLLIVMFAVGITFPLCFSKNVWLGVIMVYLFMASVMPMWLLMQPRDYLSTFMLLGMIVGAVAGVVVAHPTMKIDAFTSFTVNGNMMFPALFVTIACGAVSGFHSLVSSETSSKTISNEKDMPMVGYGAMVVESLLAVVALVCAGSLAKSSHLYDLYAAPTPFQTFSYSVTNFLHMFGIPTHIASCFMTMCVSALALTSLDSVARIGRMSFQELFTDVSADHSTYKTWRKILTNKYFSTVITLFFGFLLCLGGYQNVWTLFGSANQLLAALVLITIAVFLKVTGRKGWTLYFPMVMMLVVTFTALIKSVLLIFDHMSAGTFKYMTDGLQLIIALLLMVLGVLVAYNCFKKLLTTKKAETEN